MSDGQAIVVPRRYGTFLVLSSASCENGARVNVLPSSAAEQSTLVTAKDGRPVLIKIEPTAESPQFRVEPADGIAARLTVTIVDH